MSREILFSYGKAERAWAQKLHNEHAVKAWKLGTTPNWERVRIGGSPPGRP